MLGLRALALGIACTVGQAALAREYPSKPVKIILPCVPGGPALFPVLPYDPLKDFRAVVHMDAEETA